MADKAGYSDYNPSEKFAFIAAHTEGLYFFSKNVVKKPFKGMEEQMRNALGYIQSIAVSFKAASSELEFRRREMLNRKLVENEAKIADAEREADALGSDGPEEYGYGSMLSANVNELKDEDERGGRGGGLIAATDENSITGISSEMHAFMQKLSDTAKAITGKELDIAPDSLDFRDGNSYVEPDRPQPKAISDEDIARICSSDYTVEDIVRLNECLFSLRMNAGSMGDLTEVPDAMKDNALSSSIDGLIARCDAATLDNAWAVSRMFPELAFGAGTNDIMEQMPYFDPKTGEKKEPPEIAKNLGDSRDLANFNRWSASLVRYVERSHQYRISHSKEINGAYAAAARDIRAFAERYADIEKEAGFDISKYGKSSAETIIRDFRMRNDEFLMHEGTGSRDAFIRSYNDLNTQIDERLSRVRSRMVQDLPVSTVLRALQRFITASAATLSENTMKDFGEASAQLAEKAREIGLPPAIGGVYTPEDIRREFDLQKNRIERLELSSYPDYQDAIERYDMAFRRSLSANQELRVSTGNLASIGYQFSRAVDAKLKENGSRDANAPISHDFSDPGMDSGFRDIRYLVNLYSAEHQYKIKLDMIAEDMARAPALSRSEAAMYREIERERTDNARRLQDARNQLAGMLSASPESLEIDLLMSSPFNGEAMRKLGDILASEKESEVKALPDSFAGFFSDTELRNIESFRERCIEASGKADDEGKRRDASDQVGRYIADIVMDKSAEEKRMLMPVLSDIYPQEAIAAAEETVDNLRIAARAFRRMEELDPEIAEAARELHASNDRALARETVKRAEQSGIELSEEEALESVSLAAAKIRIRDKYSSARNTVRRTREAFPNAEVYARKQDAKSRGVKADENEILLASPVYGNMGEEGIELGINPLKEISMIKGGTAMLVFPDEVEAYNQRSYELSTGSRGPDFTRYASALAELRLAGLLDDNTRESIVSLVKDDVDRHVEALRSRASECRVASVQYGDVAAGGFDPRTQMSVMDRFRTQLSLSPHDKPAVPYTKESILAMDEPDEDMAMSRHELLARDIRKAYANNPYLDIQPVIDFINDPEQYCLKADDGGIPPKRAELMAYLRRNRVMGLAAEKTQESDYPGDLCYGRAARNDLIDIGFLGQEDARRQATAMSKQLREETEECTRKADALTRGWKPMLLEAGSERQPFPATLTEHLPELLGKDGVSAVVEKLDPEISRKYVAQMHSLETAARNIQKGMSTMNLLGALSALAERTYASAHGIALPSDEKEKEAEKERLRTKYSRLLPAEGPLSDKKAMSLLASESIEGFRKKVSYVMNRLAGMDLDSQVTFLRSQLYSRSDSSETREKKAGYLINQPEMAEFANFLRMSPNAIKSAIRKNWKYYTVTSGENGERTTRPDILYALNEYLYGQKTLDPIGSTVLRSIFGLSDDAFQKTLRDDSVKAVKRRDYLQEGVVFRPEPTRIRSVKEVTRKAARNREEFPYSLRNRHILNERPRTLTVHLPEGVAPERYLSDLRDRAERSGVNFGDAFSAGNWEIRKNPGGYYELTPDEDNVFDGAISFMKGQDIFEKDPSGTPRRIVVTSPDESEIERLDAIDKAVAARLRETEPTIREEVSKETKERSVSGAYRESDKDNSRSASAGTGTRKARAGRGIGGMSRD